MYTGVTAVPENLRSPDIYQPKTIAELLLIKSKNPNAMLWGGGTYIMADPNYYPNPEAKDIIRLNKISELFRIQHTDKYIEAGSMVTIQHLINNGNTILSKPVIQALSSVGNTMIRNSATLGGSLSIFNFRTSICCILATIGATAELRFFNRLNYSRWINVSKLYDNAGNFLYADKAFITKVRIPAAENQFAQIFLTIDSPLRQQKNSLSFGLQYTVSQGNIMQPSVCITFPVSGFVFSGEIENRINSINLPVNPDAIVSVSEQISLLVKKNCPNASDLQMERVKRLIQKVLFDINSRYLAG